MRYVLKSILLLAMASFIFSSAQASHIAAADVYYEYVSPLTYKVHLKLYRDCSGINLGGTTNMTAESISCGQNQSFTVDTNNVSDPLNGQFVDELCNNIQSNCINPSSQFLGYQYFHYAATITLPTYCNDWIFRWVSCCRNPGILNIGSNSTCLFATLNNVDRAINNSTVLTIQPIPYTCVNQPVLYLNGPIDPDLDSVVFVASPAGNNTVPGGCAPYAYTVPYNFNQPIAALGANTYNVDQTTGTASFTPTQVGAWVLAFTATEYDKQTGVMVGAVQRDVQINIVNCNTAPPSITQPGALGSQIQNLMGATMLSNNPVVLTVCPGQQMSFDVEAVAQTATNLVKTESNNLFTCPGSTYTSNPLGGGNPVTGSFDWTPTAAQIGDHTLIITFKDSTCTTGQPIVLKAYQVVLIKVLQGVDAGPDLPYCLTGDSVQINALGPITVTQWTWTDLLGNPNPAGLSSTTIPNPKAAPLVTTTYIINTNANTNCKNSDTITVNVFPGIAVSAGPDITICANDAVALGASATPPPPNSIINWSLGSDSLSDSTVLNPIANPLVSTSYTLFYIDDNGCEYTDSMNLIVDGARPILNASASEDSICPGYPFQLFSNAASQPCALSVFPATTPYNITQAGTGNAQSTTASPYYAYFYDGYRIQMIYTAAELQQLGIKPGNIESLQFRVLTKASDSLRNYRIKMGCTNLEQFDPSAGFVPDLTEVFYSQAYYTQLGWNMHDFDNEYFWDGVSNLIVECCYNYTSFTSTFDVVESSNTGGIRVLHDYINQGAGCGIPATNPFISANRPNTRFSTAEVANFNYNWTPGGSLTNPTSDNPVSTTGILNTTTYTVTAVSPSNPNCTATDVVTVNIDNSNSITSIASPAILCEPGVVTLSSTPNGTPPRYDCGEQNTTCATPSAQYVSGLGIASSTAITPLYGTYAGAKSQMIFTAAELTAMGFTGASRIDEIALDVATKSSTSPFNLEIRMGCTSYTSFANGMIPSGELIPVFSAPYTTVVGANSFLLNNPYVWDGVENLAIEMCYFNGNFNNPGADAVNYSITTNSQFTVQGSQYGGCDIPFVQGTTAPVVSTARPNVTFTACELPAKVWEYTWDPATFVFDSTAQTTTAYVPTSRWFTVSTEGGNKCLVQDSVEVIISTHGIDVFPKDTVICDGDNYQAIAIGSGNAPSETFNWYDQTWGTTGLSCTNCPSPIISPPGPGVYTYYAIRTDAYGCEDTMSIDVTVNPTPNVIITNGDSITIQYGSNVQLFATGATRYNWSPSWGMSNPNVANPVLGNAESTEYVVIGLDENGCGNSDTIYVTVNYKDNLYVPTGFSPNGDGNNDRFRVANLTFQKVQEFRVYNRWGQEVFSANDNSGWDGTFKGEPQDGNTFYYLIKVAFADGEVKIFQGDVSIIN